MNVYAFIIAIEEYPQAKDVSRTLPGTTTQADQFAKTLIDKFNLPPENLFVCTSSELTNFPSLNLSEHIAKADSLSIRDAILNFIDVAREKTSLLFFYAAGHGVSKLYIAGNEQIDLLLCSDFSRAVDHGDRTIRTDQLVALISRMLGNSIQSYFFDICRVDHDEIIAPVLTINRKPATSGVASYLTFFSTRPGNVADTNDYFVSALAQVIEQHDISTQNQKYEKRPIIDIYELCKDLSAKLDVKQRNYTHKHEVDSSYDAQFIPQKIGSVNSLVDANLNKKAPVELLKEYDEAIFLGETNWQLPTSVKEAFALRDKRKWKSLIILSLKNFDDKHFEGKDKQALELKRNEMEKFFQENAELYADQLRIMRYEYQDRYVSCWKTMAGKRRVHFSSRIKGIDIKSAPSQDFVDFGQDQHPVVQAYFDLAHETMKSSHVVFEYPKITH